MSTDFFDRSLYIETFGCQMNVADSEVIAAVLAQDGYRLIDAPADADAVILNTCSIRDAAERRVMARIAELRALRRRRSSPLIIGVVGCMAERLGHDLAEKYGVDLVAGPDAYLDLPALVAAARAGQPAVNVELSASETYADVIPARIGNLHISGFISIMRGCNNFCSYCIVPYTRGRERSRSPRSILAELADLRDKGYREVTLLGQNVDSYRFEGSSDEAPMSFADLLRAVADAAPQMRVRFTTSHPRDMNDDTLRAIASRPNLCRHIHLPVQSGSDSVLKAMNRRYTRADYLARVEAIRSIIPGCGLSTDLFTGFHGETDADHQASLSLMRQAAFDSAFMFKYSERPGTFAARHLPDNVPDEVKVARLNEMIALQGELSLASNRADIGREMEILIEAPAKRNPAEQLIGRSSTNKAVVLPRVIDGRSLRPGDFVSAAISSATQATLFV
ncbi:MAG: tRNA (N6-isopentenyl adenosine(37)-C2)-methylthiotransferase MiaB [Pseudoflavonifractor sp.]|nr:tRNA (N6-isopentenyl adenosine(37)-C2)-methylthiotransferase MiaB [Alloprevotella sp.]MCM1117654.1 tRNA (N6-isopentenyl adenosine(37)-C2)-methylthiotransferase MiaB [Pseudoflavonifractor sp.]